MKEFTSIEAARSFVSAGNAIVTLQSRKTGVHYTYRVVKSDSDDPRFPEPVWWVSVLTDGSIDEGTLVYIGMVRNGRFSTTKASENQKNARHVLAFDYFYRARDLSQISVRHEGKCGKCGRTLTEPESIETGLGPVCRSKET